MDPRRLLIPAIAGLGLTGCALPGALGLHARPTSGETLVQTTAPSDPGAEAPAVISVAPAATGVVDAPDPAQDTAIPFAAAATGPGPTVPRILGRPAITAANVEARAASASDGFVGGVQVFAWAPGRVYEVWTAPMRVTTLTLGPGESLVAKAAGDTVRWQIGETASGEGASRRSHVLIKPLERGLETNLVLTTSRRVYFLDLRSGGADAFNTAVAWDEGDVEPPPVAAAVIAPTPEAQGPVVSPAGPLDARYAIEPQGRRPRWTPVSVFDDGQRTFIAFSDDLRTDEAPALFLIAPDGEAQLVNYRQAGGLFIVDRLFDRAELRLGDRRPGIVRIHRRQGAVR